jgi:hypothetical protein
MFSFFARCKALQAGDHLDMSMEIYALSDRQLTSIAEWQQAIDA